MELNTVLAWDYASELETEGLHMDAAYGMAN